jgi:hypothetical protein
MPVPPEVMAVFRWMVQHVVACFRRCHSCFCCLLLLLLLLLLFVVVAVSQLADTQAAGETG